MTTEWMRDVFWRGTAATLVVLVVTVAAGVGLTRFVLRGLRSLEARVVAMREGREVEPDGLTAAEEFGRLTHELDLLEQQLRTSSHDVAATSRVLERLGEMSAGVAHELRNPLQTLSLQMERLEIAAEHDPELKDPVRDVQSTIARLDRAARGFLAIARLRPLAVTRLDTAELLRGTAEAMEPEANLAGLELAVEPGVDESMIDGDPGVLRQMLENLIRNAIQAQPSADGRIGLRCRMDGKTLRIEVEDSGPGIPDEARDRVFDLFYTTRESGTGVGMTLVRQATEIHGGTVRIDTGSRGGTLVTVELPQVSG